MATGEKQFIERLQEYMASGKPICDVHFDAPPEELPAITEEGVQLYAVLQRLVARYELDKNKLDVAFAAVEDLKDILSESIPPMMPGYQTVAAKIFPLIKAGLKTGKVVEIGAAPGTLVEHIARTHKCLATYSDLALDSLTPKQKKDFFERGRNNNITIIGPTTDFSGDAFCSKCMVALVPKLGESIDVLISDVGGPLGADEVFPSASSFESLVVLCLETKAPMMVCKIQTFIEEFKNERQLRRFVNAAASLAAGSYILKAFRAPYSRPFNSEIYIVATKSDSTKDPVAKLILLCSTLCACAGLVSGGREAIQNIQAFVTNTWGS